MTYTHLIIVPCHSIWKGGESLGRNPLEWYLSSYQVEGNDNMSFIEHLLLAEESLMEDEKAIMIISGGKTKAEAGPISEAESYHRLLKSIWNRRRQTSEGSVENRVHIEPYARDSFENVLFLICKFHDVCNEYPELVTICGFEFKKKRFVQLHLENALGFDRLRVQYKGNSPMPPHQGARREAYFEDIFLNEGITYDLFSKDLYGSTSSLVSKRNSRNPFQETHGYKSDNPAISSILESRENNGYTRQPKAPNLTFPWN